MNREKIDVSYSVRKAVRILWGTFCWNLIVLFLRLAKGFWNENVFDVIIRFSVEYCEGQNRLRAELFYDSLFDMTKAL